MITLAIAVMDGKARTVTTMLMSARLHRAKITVGVTMATTATAAYVVLASKDRIAKTTLMIANARAGMRLATKAHALTG